LFEPKKKWGESTTTVGQYIEICAFFYRFSRYWNFFFVNSLSSRLGDNSRRYHYTWAMWLLLSPVEDREKKIEEKESTDELDISCRTYRRKKEMNSVTIVIYFANYHETNAYLQCINLQCAPYDMTSSYIWRKLVTIYECVLILFTR
jgi:hypothetical protein